MQSAYCCMLPHFWPSLTLFFTGYLNYRIVPLGVETVIDYVKLCYSVCMEASVDLSHVLS